MALPSVGIHPALGLSLRHQARARMRRLGQSFATPRRIALSVTAVILACIWLGNVVASLLFREPYGQAALETWACAGLTVYTLWHLIRTAWERPGQGLEWTASEEQFLVSGPFTRRQLVQYRLMVVATSAVLKATVATLLLLPDLTTPWLGLLALCLALYVVELVRIGLDTLTSSFTVKEYAVYRLVVLGVAGAAVLWILNDSLGRWSALPQSNVPALVRLVTISLESLQNLASTPAFLTISSGFSLFVDLLVCTQVTWTTMGMLGIAAGVTWVMMEAVLRLDAICQRRQHQQEAANLTFATRDSAEIRSRSVGSLPRVFLGAVAWRQFCGMRIHLVGVLLALVAPAMLSFLPFVMLNQAADSAFINFVASLGFYTLLLLPSALKFDFRRDFDRLLALKMLPSSPLRITLGQVAVPVLIATVFQWSMVLIAYLSRPVAPGYAFGAICLFLPANLAIFGVDNLLFLMFPHRLKQEGLDVFLRTTLVFTAKGLIFAVLFVGVAIWAVAARSLSESLLAMGLELCVPIVVFGVGLWALVAITAGGAVGLTAAAFRHFDPSRGTVA